MVGLEMLLAGVWTPLETANETPIYPCRIGEYDDLLASAWLALHTDHAAYDDTTRRQLITPRYIDHQREPILLVTRNGRLEVQLMEVGKEFEVDLLLPHALLPRTWAVEVLNHGHERIDGFEEWWETLYDHEDVPPVLAWSTRPA